ncbi:ThuA domain-containing protein [Flavobacterium johnsoniae]|uniref:ThuA domain-containing protein n=1 Tax=Flavobacterium johnsoniae TaxID=986 RepID=UPI00223BB8E6|nr:ThuA domain-containing protein [Flavobacterium johnsoniae]
MKNFNSIYSTAKKGIFLMLFLVCFTGFSQHKKEKTKFKVIAFYTAKNDQAHISFVHEANKWFPKIAQENHFVYDSTSNWNNLNAKFLADYQVVLFLDTRPEAPEQREAFQKYMENGGGFIGFHFSAFALKDSSYPQNWDWYHNTFLGSGEYGSNTWKPTSAVLRVENQHPATKNLPKTFTSAPNEWYRWSNDLTKNPDIKILLAIDESSFPLGTGPKAHEIWHSGYFPVVWTNTKYKMFYVNMGHNDIDYEGKTNKTLSYTFDNKIQNQLILNELLWLGNSKKIK